MICNHGVAGSSPAAGTSYFPGKALETKTAVALQYRKRRVFFCLQVWILSNHFRFMTVDFRDLFAVLLFECDEHLSDAEKHDPVWRLLVCIP